MDDPKPSKQSKRISHETRLNIIKQLESGMHYDEIAAANNVAVSTVYYYTYHVARKKNGTLFQASKKDKFWSK